MDTLLQNKDIQLLLPHRYPIQLVDKVIAFDPGKEITAVKAVGIGEPFFRGHFPGFPIMPGVLIVEALGQTCALLLELTRRNWQPGEPIDTNAEDAGLGILGGIKTNMLKPVYPGTLLRLHAKVDWSAGPASCLKVLAYDEKNKYVSGKITVAMASKDKLMPSVTSFQPL